MKLRALAEDLAVDDTWGEGDPEITGIAYDSREVRAGTLFICVRGERSDGHDFAPAAVEDGAPALIVERHLPELQVPQICVADARAAMAPLALSFYGDPSGPIAEGGGGLAVAGVTGTNGKTTTAFLIRHLLEATGTQTGLLGTVKSVIGGEEDVVARTTPEAIDLQGILRSMLDAGDRACAIEVSSHALKLGRTALTTFAVGVFTNLTQDHLDFHPDMEDYFQAKAGLFRPARGKAPAHSIVNVDDSYGRRIVQEIWGDHGRGPGELRTYSATGVDADLRAVDVAFDAAGSTFTLELRGGQRHPVRTRLPGLFNVANSLAALGAAIALGVEPAAAVAALESAVPVPGRMEPVDEGQPFAVLVDYAHTPDSLENVLAAARELTSGRLICVFGCGGDRDRAKRPLMGEIAARLSNLAIATSDNPRSEDPPAILEDIVEGVRDDVVADPARFRSEVDRRAAIAHAFKSAGAGDTVVIAGKGHEQGQEFEDGRKLPFDDREVAREELRRLGSGAPVR